MKLSLNPDSRKRVDSYIENRLSVFKKINMKKIIDVTIDKELQNFKNKANRYLIDQKLRGF